MYTIVLVLFSATLAHAQGDPRSLCPGVCPIRRHPASAEGMWWTILSTKTSTGECGLWNNQCPCKCIGYKICSYYSAPYVPDYNVTTVGYDTRDKCYDEMYFNAYLVDRNSPYTVYYITDKRTGETATLALLDTDDAETFLLLYVCDRKTEEGDPLVFVISRDIRGLCEKTEQRIWSVLEANNINPNRLKRINRRNCPYYLG